jgi:PilZ domain
MPNPAFNHDPQSDRHDDTVRLWLSQQQWMSVLQNTERQARQTDFPNSDNQRQSPRLPAPQQMRCLIRLGIHADHAGTFMVKLRDVSATGLGFFSTQPFTPKSRCTVALQDGQGHGLVAAASIVWCKSIDEQLHDVGIQFDQPISAPWLVADPPQPIPI